MRKIQHRRLFPGIFLGILAVTFGLGCGPSLPDGPERYPVSGEVTYDGKPIPKGKIYFEPDSEKGNSGPQSGADIIDGKYATADGKGVVGGPHKIKIVGYDGVETKMEGEVLADGTPLFPPYETTYDFPKEEGEHSFAVPKAEGQ